MKSFTDFEQSKKLAEILPLESADMCCYQNQNGDINYYGFPFLQGNKASNPIPCWSLVSLFGVLPEIQGGKPVIALDDNYITYPHMSDLHTKAENLVDACYELILKLNELYFKSIRFNFP